MLVCPKSIIMDLLVQTIELILVLFVYNTKTAKILAVFPTPCISHQVVFRPLTKELVKRGHKVTVITTDPEFPKGQTPENLSEIDVHDVSYTIWKRQMAVNHNGDQNNIRKILQGFNDVTLEIFEEQTKVAEVQNIINNKSEMFDLVIIEAWARFFLGFSYTGKAPVITISSFGVLYDNSDVIGAPSHPVLYPQMFNSRIYNLSLWENLEQCYHLYSIMDQHKNNLQRENAATRRIFGDNTACLNELQNNIEMLLLNMHPLWEGTRPVPPSVINIGGIYKKPAKELPPELKDYLDSSKYGVIYISFGTNVDTSTLPLDKIQKIINVVSDLPYEVLWKWTQDEMPGRTERIRISKWFPQNDLLRHPKIKLFITQGGLQSTEEAIAAGVPVIAIPMIGDQWFNGEKYVHHKIGTFIEFKHLEEDRLRTAIEDVIRDESYRENVMRLRSIFNDQPISPLARAVWWTEHVLRHGGARYLRSPAANMPWTQYYEVELLLTLVTVALAVVFLTLLLLLTLIKYAFRILKKTDNIKRS